MNRVVHAHVKSIQPENASPDALVFLGAGARPNTRFQVLCALAGIKPRTNVDASGSGVGPLSRRGSPSPQDDGGGRKANDAKYHPADFVGTVRREARD
jgi:hypothetical protein